MTTDGLGLFTGVPAALAGFRTYQPVLSVAPPGRVESSAAPTAAARRSSATASAAGSWSTSACPGFGAALSHDAGARALIDQIWTVVSK